MGGGKSEKYCVISLGWKQDRVGFFTFIHQDTRDPGQYDRKLKKKKSWRSETEKSSRSFSQRNCVYIETPKESVKVTGRNLAGLHDRKSVKYRLCSDKLATLKK